MEKFLRKYLNEEKENILKAVGIDDFPNIYISTAPIRSIYFTMGIFQVYRGIFAELNFNTDHIFDNIELISKKKEEVREHTAIILYTNRIKEKCIKIPFISKLLIIQVLIHELTHYKQHLEKINLGWRETCKTKAAYKVYKKDPLEVKANKAGFKFIRKNLFKILFK